MKKRNNSILILVLLSNILFGQKIDTKHLTLNLKFDWIKRQAFGTADLTFSVLHTTNKILLDAGYLNINSILIHNKPLKFNYLGGDTNDNLEITLDQFYTPNTFIQLTIHYQTMHENKSDPNSIWGSFGKGLRFQQPTSTTPTKRKQIWSSGEPNNNKYWFPCNEDIADIHTTEFIATVEKPLMVISNGNLIETVENKDSTRTYHYKSEIPFPNYLVSLVIGEYVDVIQNSNGITIHNYGYPHELEAVKATTELLPEMMQFIEEKTAYKYPYPHYTQVVVQDYPFPGLIGQHRASIISDNYIDDYGVHKDFKYLWDGVAVQALTNQWFGNLLMPKSWDDIWLNKAFGQYFAGLFTIKDNAKTEYLSYYLPFEKNNALGNWNANNKHPLVTQNIKDPINLPNDNDNHYKGSLVLRMLQKEIGESDWWNSVQLFVKSNVNKQINTKDFQQAIEQTTGKSYQWFFDQWIYKMGIPKFEVTKQYNTSKKELKLIVNQIQKKDSSTEYGQADFFQGKMEIEIDRNIIPIQIHPKKENIYYFTLSKAPDFVNFNFEDNWICETEYLQSTHEYLYQLLQSHDVVAKQKALDQLVVIAQDTSTNPMIKNKIIHAFQQEITSNGYWRYRQYALVSLRKILTLPYDDYTTTMLLNLIISEMSWLKGSAINMLGNTKNVTYVDIYQKALNDNSDRVINAAAIALGKTKSIKAKEILIALDKKPSWKNQSRISALNGLEQLGDTSTVDFIIECIKDKQSPRWYLATPVWDYPFTAINTLIALGKAELAYPILFDRIQKSLLDNDLNDIFQNVQLIELLKLEQSKEVYVLLQQKFKNDPDILETISMYESNFLESIKK